MHLLYGKCWHCNWKSSEPQTGNFETVILSYADTDLNLGPQLVVIETMPPQIRTIFHLT